MNERARIANILYAEMAKISPLEWGTVVQFDLSRIGPPTVQIPPQQEEKY